jgi:DNA-binding transcriptional ArsR family regulator
MHVEVLQTLGDPTRLRIVEILRGGEHSVNDVVENVDIDQSGVSRHLRILQEVSQYRQLWEGRLDKFAGALARKRDAKKARP